MLVYRSFIYLQNHKTGCSFVEACLREFCVDQLLAYKKHACLRSDPGRFCFINVRNPYSVYRSLFAYGLDKRGEVYQRLVRSGKESLYAAGPSGFSRWLEFIFEPTNARLLAENFTESASRCMGFVTWRFLRLACPGFEEDCKSFDVKTNLEKYFIERNILADVVRQENLKDDLFRILSSSIRPYFPDQVALKAWLAAAPHINKSESSLNINEGGKSFFHTEIKDALVFRNYYEKQ